MHKQEHYLQEPLLSDREFFFFSKYAMIPFFISQLVRHGAEKLKSTTNTRKTSFSKDLYTRTFCWNGWWEAYFVTFRSRLLTPLGCVGTYPRGIVAKMSKRKLVPDVAKNTKFTTSPAGFSIFFPEATLTSHAARVQKGK